MKVFAIISLFAATVLAAPAANAEADALADASPKAFPLPLVLEKRVSCASQPPACPGGDNIGQTHCVCDDQVGPCHLRACPDGHRQVCGSKGDNCPFSS